MSPPILTPPGSTVNSLDGALASNLAAFLDCALTAAAITAFLDGDLDARSSTFAFLDVKLAARQRLRPPASHRPP